MRCLIFLFPLGITILMLFFLVSGLSDQFAFAQRTPMLVTKGTVTQADIQTNFIGSSDEDSSCTIHVQFFTKQHQRIVISSVSGISGGPAWPQCDQQPGNVVDVAYPVANPQDARIVPAGGFLWGSWPIFAGIIVVLLVGGTLSIGLFRYGWD